MSLLYFKLRQRWFELFENLGIRSDYHKLNKGFFDLFCKYSERNRHYHTSKHLLDCLEEFDGARKLAENPLAVESALWFHDAIYDTQAKDNEEKSAQYARKALYELKLPDLFLEKTSNLVLLTKHTIEPGTIDEEIIVDIDLSIFGKPEQEFDEYESNIRKEYSWASEYDFKVGRSKILKYFLDRDSLYKTDLFRDLYEIQARRNLDRSIRKLSN